jgi:phage-related protein
MGSAKKDLDSMPEDVKDVFGFAIDLAQAGKGVRNDNRN